MKFRGPVFLLPSRSSLSIDSHADHSAQFPLLHPTSQPICSDAAPCAKLSEKAKEDVSSTLPCDFDQWKVLLAFDEEVAAAEKEMGGSHVHVFWDTTPPYGPETAAACILLPVV